MAITQHQPIPFNLPLVSSKASEYVLDVLKSPKHCGNGNYGKRCLSLLADWSQAKKVYLTPSCTAALEMSALLLNLQPGDEVIVPSYTFVSTACAFAILGAKIVFADVCPETVNIDPQHVKSLITPRTKAIVPVHYGGVGCKMDELQAIADECGAVIVEDNAQGLFGSIKQPNGQSRPLGSFGFASTVSFHETKNFGCGEGGALMINHEEWTHRADIIQEKGTDRSRFLLGQIDKYTWVDKGSSYLLGELPAALLLANLEDNQSVQSHRIAIWNQYRNELSSWAESHGVGLPNPPEWAEHPAHLFFLMMPNQSQRTSLTEHLKALGISAAYHYQPLHLSPMGQKFGGKLGDCPVSENIAECLVRLPIFASLSATQAERVVEGVLAWRP